MRFLSHRVLVLLLVGALAALGLSHAPAARAATSGSVSGTGPGTSPHLALAAGTYRITFDYSNNVDGPSSYLASSLVRPGGGGAPLAGDLTASGHVERILELRTASDVWFKVSYGAASTQWTGSVQRLAVPAAASASFTVNGTGRDTSNLIRVDPGTYRVQATWTGNTDSQGDDLMLLAVEGWTGTTSENLVSETAASGSVTTTISNDTSCFYIDGCVMWFYAHAAAPDATWSITVTPVVRLFTSTPRPTVTGRAKVGKTLRARPGAWRPTGATLKYQWYAGTTAIRGATKSSLTVRRAMAGKKLKVAVTATKSGYRTVKMTSTATRKVAR